MTDSRSSAPQRAAVVGSGFGGLAAAIRLQAMGVHSTLFERAEQDLRAPFRERGAHEAHESRLWHQPVFWLVLLLLAAAAAFVLWPARANLSLPVR